MGSKAVVAHRVCKSQRLETPRPQRERNSGPAMGAPMHDSHRLCRVFLHVTPSGRLARPNYMRKYLMLINLAFLARILLSVPVILRVTPSEAKRQDGPNHDDKNESVPGDEKQHPISRQIPGPWAASGSHDGHVIDRSVILSVLVDPLTPTSDARTQVNAK
jgi:hypothetical protein